MILEKLFSWATYFFLLFFAGLFVLLNSVNIRNPHDDINKDWS
ncbi:hypothetical protein ACFL27_02915 [candidate division CSSED10-310 bacterium]|uniref:Uncharacterized protein n=1 Tax=candidate division CSSED10-310 bacterium TaxID=2855610 RepID=A0ABV6YSG8_UNCC1